MSAPDLAALVWATVIVFALLSAGAVVAWAVAWARVLCAEIRELRVLREEQAAVQRWSA